MPPSTKKQKISVELPERREDGRRGQSGLLGWWISLDEAKAGSVGREEWWTYPDKNGFVVNPLVEHYTSGSPLPTSKPVWMYENGDMYVGNWERKSQDYPLEEGFGITYNNYPDKCQGNVYIGEWERGTMHGEGVSFWLPSSQTWTSNRLGASPIKWDANTNRSAGIPFRYEGSYIEGKKQDEQAVVTLKEGTSRQGEWENSKPVGGWYSHTEVVPAAAPAAAAVVEVVATAPRQREARQRREAPGSRACRRSSRQVIKQEEPILNNNDNRNPKINTEVIDISDSDESDIADAPQVTRNAATNRIKTENGGTDDDNETSDHTAGSTNNNNNAATGNPQQTLDEKLHRVRQIRDWLTQDIIGNNPSSHTMERYAGVLFEKGFESVEMIKAFMKDRHVESFDWMVELHKEVLLEHLQDGWPS